MFSGILLLNLLTAKLISHVNFCFISLGYAFLLYKDELSVQRLIEACMMQDGKLYLCVSSPTIKDKPVSL